jgi:hypothetical protein
MYGNSPQADFNALPVSFDKSFAFFVCCAYKEKSPRLRKRGLLTQPLFISRIFPSRAQHDNIHRLPIKNRLINPCASSAKTPAETCVLGCRWRAEVSSRHSSVLPFNPNRSLDPLVCFLMTVIRKNFV